MQVKLEESIKHTPEGQTAEQILRKCVHCGFCLATCPTYQLLGDELDSPRGRIYLIKQMLEGEPVTRKTQLHLDRCLTCRACETTCPSGVEYGRLVDIGREVAEARVQRTLGDGLLRRALRAVIAEERRFRPLLRAAQALRPMLPAVLRAKVPEKRAATEWPAARHGRRMLALGGCVQPALAPGTDVAAARTLDALGISLVRVPETGCCGAVSYHLSARGEALRYMRRNIEACEKHLDAGAQAIVVTASACAAMVKDYALVFDNDPAYAARAERVSRATKDLSEVLSGEDLSALGRPGDGVKVAFHSPCTLQHGQKLVGVVEPILQKLGYELTPVADSHLCCGSAGTYSILQRALSERLLANKVEALTRGEPALIATANVGCHAHIASRAPVPVKHWIELASPLPVPTPR